jgi:hypothetical protein
MSKRLWYHLLFLVEINGCWFFSHVYQQLRNSGLLFWTHSLNQSAAFALRVLNHKVTRDFLSKSGSIIARQLVLEHYKVVTGLTWCLKIDFNFVNFTSCDPFDVSAYQSKFVSFHFLKH